MRFKILIIAGLFLVVVSLILIVHSFTHKRILPIDLISKSPVTFFLHGKSVTLSSEQEERYELWLKENASDWTMDTNSHADTDMMIKGANYKIIFLLDDSVVFQGYNMGFLSANLRRQYLNTQNLLEIIK